MTKNNEAGWNLDNSYATFTTFILYRNPPYSRKFTGVS